MLAAKCNKVNMGKVIAALEGDDYEQGHSELVTVTITDGVERRRHCCVGVSCDLSRADGVGDWQVVPGTFQSIIKLRFVDAGYDLDGPADHVNGGVATAGVIGWLGIDQSDWAQQLPLADDEPRSLFSGTQRNDSGETFKEIAAMLRVHYDIPKENDGDDEAG